MKHWKKPVLSVILAALLPLTLAACGAKDGGGAALSGESVSAGDLALRPEGEAYHIYTNEGMNLLIPSEYDELLLVDTARDDVLFDVSEKASVEAAKALGEDTQGAGWLFSIARVSEEELHSILCGDMSGDEVFASDAGGDQYIYYHPTDVRLVRESYEGFGDENNADWKQWTALNEWAWNSVRDTFVEENGLTPELRSNTDLDIHLNQAAYRDGVKYTVSTLQYGPLEPNGVDAAPFVERLTRGVTYDYADGEEAPDGEYVVLYFPDEDVRFDFFTADGGLVREVFGDYELLYRGVFTDGRNAHDIMQEWYDALAEANGVAAGEALSGSWQDEISQRASMDVTRNGDGGYTLTVHWGSSATEASIWEITGAFDGSGTLAYEDGKYGVYTFTESGETVSDEATTRGSFTLEDGKLRWQDSQVGENGHSEGGLFVKID